VHFGRADPKFIPDARIATECEKEIGDPPRLVYGWGALARFRAEREA
jgi:hypothetical protein